MCREHRTKFNASLTSNCDLSYWLSFNIPNEWILCVCKRLSGCLWVCVCVQKILNANKNTKEQSYKSKWWHFSLCALRCCATFMCAACFKNRMCNIYVIGTILYASSWFYFVVLVAVGSRDVRVCVFIFCHYWPPLNRMALMWCDPMLCYCCCRCCCFCGCSFSSFGISVAVITTAVATRNHIIIPKISQKTIKIIINSQRASWEMDLPKIINHKQVYVCAYILLWYVAAAAATATSASPATLIIIYCKLWKCVCVKC